MPRLISKEAAATLQRPLSVRETGGGTLPASPDDGRRLPVPSSAPLRIPEAKKTTTDAVPLTFYRGFSYGRSGETRTRGLLLPKQARYQLRNTPASGGTAAPPEYSISFFVRFVNTESAADGTARSAFFSRQKRQLATAEKDAVAGAFYGNWVRVWRNCRKADAKTRQSAKLVAL